MITIEDSKTHLKKNSGCRIKLRGIVEEGRSWFERKKERKGIM